MKTFTMDLAGRTLRVDIGRVAAQANGAAFIQYGDTTVLSTATASDKPRDGIDFFPLSVEFEEKTYAVGKIPGGFNKREGKASENSVLHLVLSIDQCVHFSQRIIVTTLHLTIWLWLLIHSAVQSL